MLQWGSLNMRQTNFWCQNVWKKTVKLHTKTCLRTSKEQRTWKSVADGACCCPAALSSSPSEAALSSVSAPRLLPHSPPQAAWKKNGVRQDGETAGIQPHSSVSNIYPASHLSHTKGKLLVYGWQLITRVGIYKHLCKHLEIGQWCSCVFILLLPWQC